MSLVDDFVLYLHKRFGISLPGWLKLEQKGDKIIAYTCNFDTETETRGIVAGKRIKWGFKPSSEFIQLFGDLALKNVVFLTKEQVYDLAKGKDLVNIDSKFIEGNGYVIGIIKHKDITKPFGCLLFINNKIINQTPKAKRLHD